MDKYQKQTVKLSLEEEKKVLNSLTSEYKEAKKAVKTKIKDLMNREDAELPHVIHQIKYQKALESQIDEALSKLKNGEYKSISDYMNDSYGTGFTSSLYRLQKQGVPLIFPMDKEEIIRAVQTNSKISGGLYKRLGINARAMKNAIRQEVTRGISSSMSYSDIARNIDNRMNSGLKKSYRIARTEGHRINQEASFDAMNKAKDSGADIVKQWDSTLDGRTRPHHSQLNGQIRELDEPFEVDGLTAMHPSAFGKASEDINCRCVVLEVAKWELDEDDTYTKFDGDNGVIVKDLSNCKNYEEFRKKYNIEVKKVEVDTTLYSPIKSKDVYYNDLLTSASINNVKYNPVVDHTSKLATEEIISLLGGGDYTSGSCASVGLAYIGQKQGYNVLDFRDGNSRKFFSNTFNLVRLSKAKGIKTVMVQGIDAITTGGSSLDIGYKLLQECKVGKEYYLVVGRHASVVRKLESGALQYLELQSPLKNGWTNFNEDIKVTLYNRFGCRSKEKYSFGSMMIDIDESDFKTDDFRSLLGYINTAETKQKKGSYGRIR